MEHPAAMSPVRSTERDTPSVPCRIFFLQVDFEKGAGPRALPCCRLFMELLSFFFRHHARVRSRTLERRESTLGLETPVTEPALMICVVRGNLLQVPLG